MTCMTSRSTDKGGRERDEVKRGTDPSAEAPRERPRHGGMAACPPEVSAFPLEVWACQERPPPSQGLHLPAPSLPELTMSPPVTNRI